MFFWSTLLVFLNVYEINTQVHGYTIIALHPGVFRVSYFHKEWKCTSLLASSRKMTRGRVAQVVRFSRDRDLRISQLDHYELASGTGSDLVCQVMLANTLRRTQTWRKTKDG